ncbi:uncharacterized protein LOC126334765 isoform X2 [Schistocerca gregaria]|nr:uncharacterized protein LOC126334765 isoform X2 [Schistocerca gregaria]XP_049853301.1 uncharacterized protein LOC126334765 isoform X2 [Schistocerca gregaria]XP_049853302.1 uncharacterized protein LOC126334765 isoform X2 [Schistocerca gregaria]
MLKAGGRGKRGLSQRSRVLRERAGLSFFLVVMFFAVFGVIVLTEVLLIDERGRGGGVGVGGRHGAGYAGRTHGFADRPDYEDNHGLLPQAEDYSFLDNGQVAHILAGPGGVPPAAEALPAGLGAGVAAVGAGSMGAAGAAAVVVEAERLQGRGGVPPGFEARLPPPAANLSAKDGTWQIVSGTRYKFFVFSAFYDARDERVVRVIGATKTRGPERVWCRLWYPPANATATNATSLPSVSVPAKVKVIRENWNLKYSACFVLCPLGRNLSAPSSVSVVSRLRLPPANRLLVRNTPTDPELRNGSAQGQPQQQPPTPPEGLAVCVKPLHFSYNQALQLVEFLELNSVLGARHFTLYNHTLGPAVDCVLRDYVARGTVTLLPWQLNMASQKEIRTEGLFAALNDCLYRSMYRYSHAALIDLDEFIIPRHNDTIPQLLRWLGTRLNTRATGSYSFQNAFFYLQWPDDAEAAAGSSLLTLRKTRRRAKLHPHKQRSKYVCRPELVVEAGNHFVWELAPGHGTLNVPADAAILHHYRVCEFGGDDCVKTPSVVDRTVHRYRQRLEARVLARWRQLRDRCHLPQFQVSSAASVTS